VRSDGSHAGPCRVFAFDCLPRGTGFPHPKSQATLAYGTSFAASAFESCFPFRVPAPCCHRPYRLGEPALPLAISSAVRFFQHGVRRKRSNSRTRPLFEFRDSLAFFSVEPSQPASASQPLLWAFGPFSTCRGRRCSPARAIPARFVPPSGFGYPLGGLHAPLPGPGLFHPGSARGIHPSEHSP
jgi:hypothetical protein